MALVDGIRAAYNLEDANDSSGNGYNLTNTGSVTFGTALIQNGAEWGGTGPSSPNTTKTLGISSNVGITTADSAFTVASWTKTPSTVITSAPQVAFDFRFGASGSSTRRIIAVIDGANTRFAFFNNAFTSLADTTDPVGNTWYHFMVTYDGSGSFVCYINNSSIGTLARGSTSAVSTHFAFNRPDDGGWNPQNLSDATFVWNRVLDSSERTQLYNGGAGIQYPFTSTTIKTWDGIARANLKTLNGVASASIKTINGIS